jgi:hypothetical protein
MSPHASAKRDPRLDVLRGLALFMIFIDHIPENVLALGTMHNFGFADAAELFVLMAGMSSMLGYGQAFERQGAAAGISRIIRRWVKLYVFQIALLLATLGIVFIWTMSYNLEPRIVRPILNDPLSGILHGLTLHAVPTYLDILPLYLALFAIFPVIYVGLRLNRWLTIAASAGLWAVANAVPSLNLPNWMDSGHWFFNPLAWQFLFTMGALLAVAATEHGGELPRWRFAVWLSAAYLMFAFFQSVPWTDWHLPDLRLIIIPAPDKTNLALLRLFDIVAFVYLLLSSITFRSIAGWRLLRPVNVCGRHSLEVFAIGCIAALFGRLLFRTFGHDLWLQLLVNAAGFAAMWAIASYLDAQVARAGGAKVTRPSGGAFSASEAASRRQSGLSQ